MLNQVVTVGRIKNFQELEDKTIVTIAVPRSYENSEGKHDEDFIDAILSGNIAKNTTEYCGIGDIIGIKGKLAKLSVDNAMSLVAEKVTFLSRKKED